MPMAGWRYWRSPTLTAKQSASRVPGLPLCVCVYVHVCVCMRVHLIQSTDFQFPKAFCVKMWSYFNPKALLSWIETLVKGWSCMDYHRRKAVGHFLYWYSSSVLYTVNLKIFISISCWRLVQPRSQQHPIWFVLYCTVIISEWTRWPFGHSRFKWACHLASHGCPQPLF